MIKSVLTLLVLLVLNNLSLGQSIPNYIVETDSIHTAYKMEMAKRYDSLDFSYINSGRLYERGFSFINMAPFNGQLSDSMASNLIVFSLAYASLTTMTIDASAALPSPLSYRNIMDTTDSNSKVIPVAGLHQFYDHIDTTAVADNLLKIEGGRMIDVLPRVESPYLSQEVFMFAPAEMLLNSANFSLFFDSNLFYNGSGKTADSLWIDLDNGMGFLEIEFNQNVQMAFAESGRKNIRVKLKYTDGTEYYSQFDLDIRSNAFRTIEDEPNFIHYIAPQNSPDPSIGRGGGHTLYLFGLRS